jgi:general stress protein 26
MNRVVMLCSGSVLGGVLIGAKYSDKVEFAKQKAISSVQQFYTDQFGKSHDKKSETESHTSSSQRLLSKAISVSRDSGNFAVLSTSSSSDGFVASRLIQPFPVEFDSFTGRPVIYFNTNKLSRKFKDMNNCPNVTLTYVNEKNMSYVTYRGPVRRIPYPKSTEHWNESLYMFYPEGNNEDKGSRFTTWALEADNIQYVGVLDGVVSERDDWRPPELQFDAASSRWVMTCNGQDERP